MSQRIALGVRYDGARYHGWQYQDPVLPTVQLAVDNAISFVANHTIHSVCAGRTDAKVHASGQVVHFDTDAERTEDAWVFGCNSNLPPDIVILWAQPVIHDFHARFSATARRYRYVIYNYPIRPGILRHAVGWYHNPLNVERMQAAVEPLLGEHDFSSFRGSGCQSSSPNRDLQECTVTRQGAMVIIEVQANAFLLHMVRNLVGVLLMIGNGQRPVEWAAEVLAAKNRAAAAMTFSPNGLYLVGVTYPDHFNIPKNPVGPFFLS